MNVIVDCKDGYGFRLFGRYVGFTYKEVKALMVALPRDWEYVIKEK